MKLNKRETALVLAGLRMLLEDLVEYGAARASVRPILKNADMEHCPPERIDRLCEKINFGG